MGGNHNEVFNKIRIENVVVIPLPHYHALPGPRDSTIQVVEYMGPI